MIDIGFELLGLIVPFIELIYYILAIIELSRDLKKKKEKDVLISCPRKRPSARKSTSNKK